LKPPLAPRRAPQPPPSFPPSHGSSAPLCFANLAAARSPAGARRRARRGQRPPVDAPSCPTASAPTTTSSRASNRASELQHGAPSPILCRRPPWISNRNCGASRPSPPPPSPPKNSGEPSAHFPSSCVSLSAPHLHAAVDRAPAAAGFEAGNATERVLGPLLRQKLREAKGYAPVPS